MIGTFYKFNHFTALLLKNISRVNSDSACLLGGAFVCLMCQCALPELSPKLLAQSSVSAASSFRWCTTPHTLHHWSIPISSCFFVSQTQIEKKTLSHSRLPPRVKKPVANCKYLWFSIRNHLLEITNICDLLPIGTDDVIYDHFLGRNPYISKRPKKQWIS